MIEVLDPSGAVIGRGVGLIDAFIVATAPFIDGLIVLAANQAGKITPNTKGAWNNLADGRDLELVLNQAQNRGASGEGRRTLDFSGVVAG